MAIEVIVLLIVFCVSMICFIAFNIVAHVLNKKDEKNDEKCDFL